MIMYTETMTFAERYAEYQKDIPELRADSRRFRATGGYKQVRAAGVQFPFQIIHECRTKSGNRYLVLSIFASRADAFGEPLEYAKAIIQTDEGMAMYTISMGNDREKGGFLFMPHVFKRYRQRMGFSYNSIDTIKTFIKRNMEFVYNEGYRRKSKKDDPKEIMLSCHDGAVFGRIDDQDDNCAILRTFISTETMQEGYKAQFDKEFDNCLDDNMKKLACKDPELAMQVSVCRRAGNDRKKSTEDRN